MAKDLSEEDGLSEACNRGQKTSCRPENKVEWVVTEPAAFNSIEDVQSENPIDTSKAVNDALSDQQLMNQVPAESLPNKASEDESRNTILSYISPKTKATRKGLAGRGIVATEKIAKDDLVCIWGGKIFNSEELAKLSDSHKHYILQIDEHLFVAPPAPDQVDAAEFFNHSCGPNLGFKGQMALVALRDIMPGEELTFDYAMSETYDQKFECRCGSIFCRKEILGTDFQLPQLRKRYRGYFSAWIERKHQILRKSLPKLKAV